MTADAVVVRHGEVLLIRRGQDPYMGMYALPGGFVEQDETPETCAVRELKEETGIAGASAGLINFYDAVDRDDFRHTIGFAYAVDVADDAVAAAGDDAAAVEWWPLEALPEMAFDHGRILSDYRKGVRLSTK